MAATGGAGFKGRGILHLYSVQSRTVMNRTMVNMVEGY